jgi:hypothetical protein
MEGNITAETFGDGDFISRITVGPKLKVSLVSLILILLKDSADPYRHSEYGSQDLENFLI